MMNMIKLSKYEKETILRTSKGDDEYSIYTFDKTLQKSWKGMQRSIQNCVN